jgi:hypothetical protein
MCPSLSADYASPSDMRILGLSFLLLAPAMVFAQDPALPYYEQPGCDSYSMQTVPSLTLEQRTCYWGDQLFTFSAFGGAALWGTVAEVRHKPPEWPQGFAGFGRQFGSRYAQGMAKSTGTFLTAALFKEDPRPIPPSDVSCPHRPTSIKGRIGASLLRVVWQNDADCEKKGRPVFSPLAGSFASGFTSLAWAPPSVNKMSSALVGTGTAYAGYFGNSVFSEFEPDLFGLIGKLLPGGRKKK